MKFNPTTIGKAESNLPPRIIISGKPKSGKTTWASKAPSPIFIPIVGEEGCNNIIDENNTPVDVMATPVVKSYEELLSILEWILEGVHEYKTVVLDSLSSCERMFWNDLCLEYKQPFIDFVPDGKKSFGKGYTMTLERFRRVSELMTEIRDTRKMVIIFIAHVTPRSMTDAETNDNYDAFDLALNKKSVSMFEQWADYMMFATEDFHIGADNKRVKQKQNKLIIHGKAHLPIGGRSIAKVMPKEIPLTWQDFHNAVKTAKSQTTKGE